MSVLICSADGCDDPAVEVLVIRGNIGHVHDCARDAAVVRDVLRSGRVLPDGSCPEAICTGNNAVWHGDPTPLDA